MIPQPSPHHHGSARFAFALLVAALTLALSLTGARADLVGEYDATLGVTPTIPNEIITGWADQAGSMSTRRR